MTEFHKEIYNTYLKVLGKASRRPYRCRKDFSNLSEDIQGCLEKLDRFFKRNPHINIEMYFIAPYQLWGDCEYYPLNFYNKRKSLICYIDYKKVLINKEPDDDYQIKKLVESLKFIRDYCIEKKISPRDYITYKDGSYAFLRHLGEYRISIYSLFAYDNFKDVFKSIDNESKKVILGECYSHHDLMYRRYLYSKKCRIISEKGLSRIITGCDK